MSCWHESQVEDEVLFVLLLSMGCGQTVFADTKIIVLAAACAQQKKKKFHGYWEHHLGQVPREMGLTFYLLHVDSVCQGTVGLPSLGAHFPRTHCTHA